MRSFFLILAHPIHHHSTSLLQFITKFLERGIQSCQTYSLHIHSFFLPLQSELHSHWSTSTSLRGHQGLPSYQACWSISSSYSQWRLLKYLRILTTLYFLKSPFLCLSLLSLKNFFNWRIIALQCCTGFCCTTTWISSMCTFISSLLSLLPTHSPHPSLWVITEPRAELSVLYSNFPLAIYSTHGNVYIGLSWCLRGKESACNAGDLGSMPELGRSPGGGKRNPLQYSCLKNPTDRGVWQATVGRVA